ncbi:MAG: transporter substrate-binding domain-containing protein [Methyloprofundus sp.]|nr:transporter substrate-binding domain-containing protein [Methyloprofundus sp.]MDT8426220.1 transporter substrate-binding domain-containing protein [Methyloprofundus sp.]
MYRLLLPLCFLLLTALAQANENKSLHMVSNQWPPYVDDSLKGHGLAIEIVTKALEKKGYQSTLTIDSWPRALEGVEIGVFDATCAIWKTSEREQDLLFSAPYLKNKISFLKKKTLNINYHQLADLKGYIIGVLRGYAYNNEFTQSRELMKAPENYLIQNLQKLNQDAIELTLDDELVINHALKQYLPEQIDTFEFLSPPLAYKNLYFAVSKSNKGAQTIIDDFNAALKEMQQDGSYDQILSQYQY